MAGEVDPVGVLGDGTVYYAPIGEVVYDGDDRVRCHLCGRSMRIVGGTHLRVGHGWTLDAYREAFQLLVKAPTCSRELSERGRENAQARLGHRRFGTPPVNAVPPVYRVPRWRSLAYARPDLISELHRTRNLGLDPNQLAVSSHQKVWWCCESCGYQWQATVDNRAIRDSGCPACALKRRVQIRSRVGVERSIAVNRPDLADELHPTRNGDLNANALGVASAQNVWWRCDTCGHAWQATVANRASGTGCPACWQARRAAAQSIVPRGRSLAAKAPQLVGELHPTRSQHVEPATLGARSSQKVWWRCGTCGHEWPARVASRTAGDGCPECAHRRQRERGPRPVPSERSLAANRPELLTELHPTRNPNLDADKLGAGSNAKVWWRCATCTHEWRAKVGNRTRGSGCPACARKR